MFKRDNIINLKGLALTVLFAFFVLVFGASSASAAVGGTTIGGCLYSGAGSATYTMNALGEPVASWNTIYNGTPITDAQIMVQSQHSGGKFVAYGTMGLGGTNCWEAVIPDTVTAGTPDAHDLIVVYSAPGHDVTSREFTWNAALGTFTHPTGADIGAGGTGVHSNTVAGGQDAYLPPLDANGELPTANLLHYVFYDNFVNGNDNGPIVEPGLNGVTVRVIDEDGNLVASQLTGELAFNAGGFITKDGATFTGPLAYGYVYFEGLPGGREYLVQSDPSTVTQADNPHLTLKSPDAASANTCFDAGTGLINYRQADCKWYQTFTEEGGHSWEAYLWPNDPGTEGGFYLTWHAFIEKMGNDGGASPIFSGSISGVILDADGNEPAEPFPLVAGGRVPPTNARYEDGTAWNALDPWEIPEVPNAHNADVMPNGHVPDVIVALFSVGDFPVLVATTEASDIVNYNLPSGGEFSFTNIMPGMYEVFVFDHDLVNVPMMGNTVTVTARTASPHMLILMPRFAGRGMGFVMNNGNPVEGATVKTFFKAGTTKDATLTTAGGWFLNDAMPETGSMGHMYLDIPDGATYRGKIITEDFQKFDPMFPYSPTNPVVSTATHNSMNRPVQWWTVNYFVDIQVEDIPGDVGNIIGNVFNDHFDMTTRTGNGVWDETKDSLVQGVTVELYSALAPGVCPDISGSVPVATGETGTHNDADSKTLGWMVPGTYPLDEVGGVYASPVTFDGTTPVAPAPGFYEFRDVAPGDYCVRTIPGDGYRRSPDTNIVPGGLNYIAVTGGVNSRVDLGVNTTPTLPAGLCEVPLPAPGSFYASFNGNGIDLTGLIGTTVRDEDIVYYDGASFHLFFDGTAAGLPGYSDIDALQVVDDDTFYVSFLAPNSKSRQVEIPAGLTSAAFIADDEDVVLYDAGNWSLYFDGTAHGLGDNNGEDITSIAMLTDGRMVFSTRGSANASKASTNPNPLLTDPAGVWTGINPRPQDEDLLVYDPATGYVDLYFDGSDIALHDGPDGLTGGKTNNADNNNEDVWGTAVTSDGDIYLTTAVTKISGVFTNDFVTNALAGTGFDVFVCRGAVTGRVSSCLTQETIFTGSAFNGFTDINHETLDAVSFAGAGTCSNNPAYSCSTDTQCSDVGSTYGVAMAGEIEGGMFEGTGYLDPNPTSLLFMEAAAMVGSPVAVYDHYNYLLGVGFQGDPNCHAFNNAFYTPGSGNPNACSSTIALEQGPEFERRFAPGVHRYNGNDPAHLWAGWDPTVPAYDPAFDSMELAYGLPQGGYLFETAWTPLRGIVGAGITADMCAIAIGGGSFVSEPWGATATVTVSDGYSFRSNAIVSGTWSNGVTSSCETVQTGQCTMTLEKLEGGGPSVTFTIDNIVDPNGLWVYNPNAGGFLSGACQTSNIFFEPFAPPPPPPAPAQCDDGVDNDGDGFTDMDDPGCVNAQDNDEANAPLPPALMQCEDGIDNDGDGLVDFPDDPGCTDALDDDEIDPVIPPPPPPGNGATTMHVSSLSGYPTWVEGKLSAWVTVGIADDLGAPVSGATVTYVFEWIPETELKQQFGTCVTDAAGSCTFQGKEVEGVASIDFFVNRVEKATMIYDPRDNVATTLRIP